MTDVTNQWKLHSLAFGGGANLIRADGPGKIRKVGAAPSATLGRVEGRAFSWNN